MGLANISATQSSTGALAAYTYLGDGTIIGETHPQVSGGLNLAVGLDRFGQVTDQKWTNDNNAVLDEYTYTYDASGNRTSRANVLDADLSEVYSYDDLGRLVNTARGGAAYQAWTLDQLGNWTGFDDNGTPCATAGCRCDSPSTMARPC